MTNTRLQEIEGRLDSALEVAQRALQVLASATRVSGGEDVYTEEVARQDYAARHSRQALDDLLSARRIAKQLRAGLAHVCGDPSTPQPSNGDVCLSCEQLRASGAVGGAAAQPAPSGNANSGSQEVTEADIRRAVEVYLDEAGVREDNTSIPDDLRAVLEDFASRRLPREGAAAVTERRAYVMAMAVLQSDLYRAGDDELRVSVDAAIERYTRNWLGKSTVPTGRASSDAALNNGELPNG